MNAAIPPEDPRDWIVYVKDGESFKTMNRTGTIKSNTSFKSVIKFAFLPFLLSSSLGTTKSVYTVLL